jgi:LysR family positive regulator for ilvC
LSRQIQRLEDQVGQVLFERDNRKVLLTPSGAAFREYARTILSTWEEAREAFQVEGRELQGELKIYSSVTGCYGVLPELLERFREAYPRVHIHLETGDHAMALDKVLSGEHDLAVAALPDNLPGSLRFKHVTDSPLLFIAPEIPWAGEDLLERDPVPWGEVPLILPEKDLARRRVEAWFKDKGIHPRIYAEAAGNEAILAMVNLGCGVGVVPELVIEKRPLRSRVKIIPVSPPLESYRIGLVVHKRKAGAPLVDAFLALS